MLTKVSCCYLTSTGMKRAENEDGLLLNDILISQKDMMEPHCNEFMREKHIYIVADGLGGHKNGSLACQTVLESFRQQSETTGDENSLLEAITKSRDTLNNRVRMDSHLVGLGVTMAGMMLHENRALIFSCGDCRVYKYSIVEGLERLSRDHSVVQGLVDKGIIDDEQMRHHPNKNIVTSGIIGDLQSDIPKIWAARLAVSPGDRFFICSDGTWENFETIHLQKLLSLDSVAYAANLIARKIAERGSRDNFSYILSDIR